MKEREPEGDPLARPRGRRSIWPTLGLVLGALALLHFAGWLITGAHFSNAVDRLRAQGEPVRPSEMAPKLKPGERNAADVYQQAFAIAPTTAVRHLPISASPPWTGQQWALAEAIVAGNQQYYDLLDEASRLDTCAFSWNWDAAFGGNVRTLHGLVWAGIDLGVRAKVEARRGDLDGALTSCATALRVARHAEQGPSSMGAYVGAGIERRGVREGLEAALSQGDPSPTACRSLSALLASRDHHALLARSVRIQRAQGLQDLRWIENGGLLHNGAPPDAGDALLTAYPTVARPVWNADKERYLNLMAAYFDAAQRPWPEAGREVVLLGRQSARLFPGTPGWFSRWMIPQASSFASAGQNAAMAGAWQIALALKAYHHDHHTYPASLAQLEKATWKLPRDPFTQQPYHYRRQGVGFAIWSVGFDAKDNGGLPFTGVGEEALRPGTDFVVRCAR